MSFEPLNGLGETEVRQHHAGGEEDDRRRHEGNGVAALARLEPGVMKRQASQRMTGDEMTKPAKKAIFTRRLSPSSGFVTRNLQCPRAGRAVGILKDH